MADGPLAVKGCKTKFHWPHWKNVKSTVQPDSGLNRMMLVVKANQLRFQDHLIGENGPELKLFQDVFSERLFRSVIGSITIKTLPGHGVDVIDDQVNVPLGKEFKRSSFGKDHSQKRVDVFHAGFLGGTHGIAVIDTGAFYPADAGFQSIRITEFSAPVGQDHLEQSEEVEGTKTFLEAVKNDLYSAFGTAVHKKGEEELFLREIESEECLLRCLRRMDSIHLTEPIRGELTEVGIQSADKNGTLGDLGLMNLPDLELHLTLQVDVSCREQSHVDVVVEGTNGEVQFRMIDEDLVRRLSLKDQRSNDGIFFPEIMFCHVDAGTGVLQSLLIFPLGEDGVIAVLLCNWTLADLFVTAVTDIGCLVKSPAAFPDEVFTGLVAGGTGMALNTAEDNLPTGIRFMTVIAFLTEVLFVDERALVVPVRISMEADFLGDRSRILTKESGDVLQ